MYLLYADESGNDDHTNFVLAGVALFEGEIAHIIKYMDDVAENYFPGKGKETEIHIAELKDLAWSGKDPNFTKQHFFNLISDLTDFVGSPAGRKCITIFASVIHRPSLDSGCDHYIEAFEGLTQRFDNFLHTRFKADDPQKGLLIIDKSSERRAEAMRQVFGAFRTAGTRWGKVYNIPEVPFFANSTATRLIQLADVLANTIFRRYEFGDAKYFDKILPGFYEQDGILHGLGHLISKKQNCMCVSCLTRKRKDT